MISVYDGWAYLGHAVADATSAAIRLFTGPSPNRAAIERATASTAAGRRD